MIRFLAAVAIAAAAAYTVAVVYASPRFILPSPTASPRRRHPAG